MTSPDGHFQWQGARLVLQVYLQPGASRNEWSGLFNGRIKIRLSAPPVKGKANHQLLEFIAGEFGVRLTCVKLEKGTANRNKTVVIQNPAQIPAASQVDLPAN